ncbi:MAG: cytochrome c biogenesis protein [Actinomycetes bacterium]|jgi:heme exporter protein C
MTRVRIWFALAGLAVAVGLWMALTAPEDALQGVWFRLFYVHVSSMWFGMLAFLITAFASIAWLLRKKAHWDRLASASVETGVLFTGIGLVVGMIWGNAVWGVAWDWEDPRLASTAVMFFVYLGYIALRQAVADPEARARRSAVLGAIAAVQVPLVYFSVNLFRTLHQTQTVRPDGMTMSPEMRPAFFVNLLAFTLLYVALVQARIYLARAEEARAAGTVAAGEAIVPPRLDEVTDV